MVVCVCRKQLAYILIGCCYCGDFTVNIDPPWRSTTRRNLRWNLLSKHGSGSSSALSHQTSRTNTWRSTAHGLWFHSRNTQRTGNGWICYTQTRATVSNQNKQMREDSDVLFFLYNSLNLNATAQHTHKRFHHLETTWKIWSEVGHCLLLRDDNSVGHFWYRSVKWTRKKFDRQKKNVSVDITRCISVVTRQMMSQHKWPTKYKIKTDLPIFLIVRLSRVHVDRYTISL